MRPDLAAFVQSLLLRSRTEGGVDIDDLAEAIYPLGVSPAEIEEVIGNFEDRGGLIRAPSGGGHAERLKVVLASARALAKELGRAATPAEIAAHAHMDIALVRAALAVGRHMGK